MNCCAVWNEQVPVIVTLRRHLVSQGQVERTVQDMLGNLQRYGNSFGKSDRLRARWTQTSGLKIKDARKEAVEYLWFVGDYASYDPRCEDITKKTARVFAQAGLDPYRADEFQPGAAVKTDAEIEKWMMPTSISVLTAA